VATFAAGAALAAPPDGTIKFKGGAVGFIAGINWGSGVLYYHGHEIPLKVGGLSVGEIGIKHFDAKGTVYNLRRVKDVEGTYAAVGAAATVGGGAGVLEMQNGSGVTIKAQSTSIGAHLKLGPSGMVIKLK
jgi:hypothetical protein